MKVKKHKVSTKGFQDGDKQWIAEFREGELWLYIPDRVNKVIAVKKDKLFEIDLSN